MYFIDYVDNVFSDLFIQKINKKQKKWVDEQKIF